MHLSVTKSFTAKFVVSRFEGFFEFFCSVNHISGLLRKHMFTCTSSKAHGLWFVIGGFRSVLFVSYFKVRCMLCDRPVSDNNRLDLKLAPQIFLIFLILVTCKNKATSASFPSTKNSTHHRDFLRYSWAVKSHSQPSLARTLHCDLRSTRLH